MDISEVGKNIRKYREQKRWSLSKLKQESGIGYATLHDIENGKSKSLNSSNLEKVAKALDVTANELLGIDIVEYTVNDISETLDMVLQSDELELDGIPIDDDEKDILKDFFSLAINSLRKGRRHIK